MRRLAKKSVFPHLCFIRNTHSVICLEMEKHAIRFILPDNKPSNPFSTVSLAEIELTMGDWQSYRKDTAFHHIGAVGGIFVVSDETKRPDEAAMRRILDRYSDSPEGIILRLAWQEGLSRKELNELTWDQVDFETQNLLLQDRTIPLEPSVAECLQKRYEQYSTISDRVVIADRGKKPMTLVNVSRLAKNALDSEGQDVALKDLRRDWIIRQIKANGWAYAARVSGMAVSSLRGIFAAALWKGTAQTDDSQGGGDETEYILWRIVQQEGSSAAGLAIWMCWKSQSQRSRSRRCMPWAAILASRRRMPCWKHPA